MTGSQSFSKKEHILKSREFSSIYKKGRSFKSNGFVLCLLPNNKEYSRLGFSISSAIVRIASLRNNIRRLFREFYRKNKTSFKNGFDIVIVVRKNPGKDFSFNKASKIFTLLMVEAGIKI